MVPDPQPHRTLVEGVVHDAVVLEVEDALEGVDQDDDLADLLFQRGADGAAHGLREGDAAFLGGQVGGNFSQTWPETSIWPSPVSSICWMKTPGDGWRPPPRARARLLYPRLRKFSLREMLMTSTSLLETFLGRV